MKVMHLSDKMIDYREEILNYIVRERDSLKELIKPIQSRRNKMYVESKGTGEWDEINYAYNEAIFLQLYDYLSGKLDLPIDELYCTLEEMDLSAYFEPSN
jgi:hypothetical protein